MAITEASSITTTDEVFLAIFNTAFYGDKWWNFYDDKIRVVFGVKNETFWRYILRGFMAIIDEVFNEGIWSSVL